MHIGESTGWSNWILLRKLKYFICCLGDLFLFLACHISTSICNTSISGEKIQFYLPVFDKLYIWFLVLKLCCNNSAHYKYSKQKTVVWMSLCSWLRYRKTVLNPQRYSWSWSSAHGRKRSQTGAYVSGSASRPKRISANKQRNRWCYWK